MSVNAKVDMCGCLRELPGLALTYQTAWKIRLLQIQGHSVALSALYTWAQNSSQEFEEIMKGVRLVGLNRLPPELPTVEKSPHYPVYAVRAKGGGLRLIYFYIPEINSAVFSNCVDVTGCAETGYALGERLRQLLQECLLKPLP